MQPRHKVPKALSSIPVLIIMVLVSLSLLVGVIQMASKTRVTGAQAREASNQLEMLEAEHSKLVADIASLETDAGKIEALRNNYRSGTEGEKLVVIVNDDEVKEDEDDKKGIGAFFNSLFNNQEEAQ